MQKISTEVGTSELKSKTFKVNCLILRVWHFLWKLPWKNEPTVKRKDGTNFYSFVLRSVNFFIGFESKCVAKNK